jgi:hypothetical protein
VCSSTVETILIGHPSVVTSNWKSTAYTRLGASPIAVGGAGAAVAFAPAALWHSKPFCAPKALHFS